MIIRPRSVLTGSTSMSLHQPDASPLPVGISGPLGPMRLLEDQRDLPSSPTAAKRSFLFLQGPQSHFFCTLGQTLLSLGAQVHKVNFCGGDVLHWPGPNTIAYRGARLDWPERAAELLTRYAVTDILLMGDKRPLHYDVICLANARGITVHVLEEGYLRPSYITMEEGGVNANSPLPATAEAVRARAAILSDPDPYNFIPDSMFTRVLDTAKHHFGNTLLFSLFPHYRTHRPYCIGRELIGWIPRYFTSNRRRAQSVSAVRDILAADVPFFLFPLQLDADMQVRSYSHFGVLDSIMQVLSSFSSAPPHVKLLIKNHPLDNGVINLRRFVRNFAAGAGITDRIVYIDGGAGKPIMEHPRCQGVVVVNSTMGLEAMALSRPVYSLGRAPYAMPGLAVTPAEASLTSFWRAPRPVDEALLADFIRILHHDALIAGNFYTPTGIEVAVRGVCRRLGLPVREKT